MISVLLASSILAAGAVSSGALSGTDDTAPAGETWTQPANLADLVENVSPSVVQITAKDKPALDLSANGDPRSSRQLFDEFMHRFFPKSGTGPDPRRSPSTGIGSGFVISSDGVIVTNHHVINHAGEISVTFSNGRVFNAEVLGSDPRTDLAVLKVEDGEEFQAIDWGGSDAVRVGDPVFAVGAPFGLSGTVTAGIVSARGREIGAGPYDDFLQTDAPINRGNSGGPLFNPAGEVIGVNTAILGPNGGNVGVGFSIPSQMARAIVDEIVVSGSVERGWLGVSIQPVSPEIAEALGLSEADGALVAEIVEDSPADAVDLKAGDIILGYSGAVIETARDLTRAVAETDAGETVEIEILRSGRKIDLLVQIAELASAEGQPADDRGVSARTGGELGLALETTDAGVVIRTIRPGSPAEQAGLAEGDRLLAVDQAEILSSDDVLSALDQAKAADRTAILLHFERGKRNRFVALPLAPT